MENRDIKKKEFDPKTKNETILIKSQKQFISDLRSYKEKYPDFSEALKGRTITLKTFK